MMFKPAMRSLPMWSGICLLMVIAIVALPEIALASKAMKSVTFDTSGAIEVAAIYETSFATQKGTMKSLKTLSKPMKKAPGFKGSTAPPVPTRTLTFELALAQPSLSGTTPALRGKQAVVQLLRFVAKPTYLSQMLEQVESLGPALYWL